MRPVTVHAVISAPREEIFDLIADLSRRPAWTDHWLRDFRLARANPVGLGAAARFFVHPPLRPRVWAEISIAEADRPRRLVEEGRTGRIGRSRLAAVYELSSAGPGATRVSLTTWTEPGHPMDALKEAIGVRGWLRRQSKTALGRLRAVFENPPKGQLARVDLAGWEPLKKARFGA
ncbi:MAG: SRPBCC family protein [Thermoleophilaceae bacterium]